MFDAKGRYLHEGEFGKPGMGSLGPN
jgi:hypothetical protein